LFFFVFACLLKSSICVSFALKPSVGVHSSVILVATLRMSGLLSPFFTISHVTTVVIMRLHSYLAASCCSCLYLSLRAAIFASSACVHGLSTALFFNTAWAVMHFFDALLFHRGVLLSCPTFPVYAIASLLVVATDICTLVKYAAMVSCGFCGATPFG
jgi:hypothetical protein